jgi:PTH1 family peptidyl-tRNA hydrolase
MSWLVVGLGNPGPTYAKTRHNAGFRVLDEVAHRLGLPFRPARGMSAELTTARLGASGLVAQGVGTQVALAEPVTFMNDSGRAVRSLADFGKIAPDHIVVVHDELDLELGRMRLKLGGGDNGHNGLKSIRAHLGTGDFYRVRVGIGRPSVGDPIDYVLGAFPKSASATVADVIDEAADAIEVLLRDGLAVAQNRFNN